MNKIIGVFFSLCILFFFASCDEDYAAYKQKTDIVEIKVTKNIYVISEAESEINDLAIKYSTNAKLSYVEYTFYNHERGNVLFHYCCDYSVNSKGYTDLVDVEVDISDSTIKTVNFTQGLSKRVKKYASNYIANKTYNSQEVYSQNIPEKYRESDMYYTKIIYSNDDILLNIYNSNTNELVESYNYK